MSIKLLLIQEDIVGGKMTESRPYILGKIFNNAKYADDLLNGKIFINPLASFGIGNIASQTEENKNNFRGDLNEGLVKNANPENGIPIRFFQDIGGIPAGTSSIGEIDSRFLYENIYCLTAIFYDEEEKSLIQLDEKLLQFDDNNQGLAVVIYKKEEFINRIVRKLSKVLGSLYWLAYGLVDYDFDESDTRESDEFTKELSYSYQQEFRIAINLNEDDCIIRTKKIEKGLIYDSQKGTLLIDIGPIRDIAFSLSVDDYINLSFPDKYTWVKYSEPLKLTCFYPPIQNRISYIYPLMRINGITFISNNGLYPRDREVNNILINNKQLCKTKDTMPLKDHFFLSILDNYYERILDICKSKNDTSVINIHLTGLMQYMLFLGIMNCAGMYIVSSEEGGYCSYKDRTIHDSTLTDYSAYSLINIKLKIPKPTDFAVLVTLSDQEIFEEYEYEGKLYTRIEVARDGVLPSGKVVKKGDAVWVEVSKTHFSGY